MERKEKQTNKQNTQTNQKSQPNPTTKTSRIFNQMTAETWNPIHLSLQPCKNFCPAAVLLPWQKVWEDRECSLFCLFWHFAYSEENWQQEVQK